MEFSINFLTLSVINFYYDINTITIFRLRYLSMYTFFFQVCGKAFCHRQSLITHSTVHTGIKPYQCEGCGKSFSCVGNLLKHRKSHAETCGLLPLTTHRVQHPSTKIKVKINTPPSSKLKEVKRNRELHEKFARLDSLSNDDVKSVDPNHDDSTKKVGQNMLICHLIALIFFFIINSKLLYKIFYKYINRFQTQTPCYLVHFVRMKQKVV